LLLVVAAGFGPLGCESRMRPWRLILSDPALCGGCRRCAITCSALRFGGPGANRGLIDSDQHYMARVFDRGDWFATTCHMCPELHDAERMREPTCVARCPTGAAQIAAPGDPLYGDSQIRFIDDEACIGCGTCVQSCPYAHPLLVEGKARKCDLCLGRLDPPPCVDDCPSSALLYLDYWTESAPRPFPWEPTG
jgi:anaerobic dimethyl sulfoxide reductase subunit B (iron-sulfur subunit)